MGRDSGGLFHRVEGFITGSSAQEIIHRTVLSLTRSVMTGPNALG